MKKFLFLLALTSVVFAQHDHGDGSFVEEGAHVHGVANLQVVVDNDALLLGFVSPAINLIGFEYEPKDDMEMAAVEDAIASLIAGDSLFMPNSDASCSLVSADASRQAEEHEHHHEPLFAEDGGVNADHPAKHMHNGPMKSIIALPSAEGNEDGLLYHAGGTHIRYDVIMIGGTAYFEYHALEAGDYVFFTDTASVNMKLVHEGMMEGAEMEFSGAMLHQEEDVFANAFVFDLEEGVHVIELTSAAADFSFVVEAQHHEGDMHEHDHHEGEHHEGEEAGAHADEEAHSHEGEGDHHEGEMHEEGHEHEHEEGAVHSEFVAAYEFSCSNIDKLDSLDLSNLFELYSGIEDLDVQYVLPTGQGADELNAENTTLNF